ncbi:MAG: exodeoxyribonuclease V subunit gamma [Gammaproteobacteria bacterium]|nr:exodeoxyribonuclease V subunit gamma [Gammaproteobacteria bacterium]
MTDSQATTSLFHVHTSDRLEALAERLADTMRAQPGDPLSPERIVVPHPLLGQWLRLQLAERLGIAAHLRIDLPAEFAWNAMREALPALSEEAIFEPAYLRWRIFERLTAWTGDDEIGRYLADHDARKRFELADRLAIAYDRCLVYRPEQVQKWQRGEADGWHARLWNGLVADQAPALHWVDALAAYRGKRGTARTPGRPRVSLFGVDTLSPSYRDVLAATAQALDVHLFLLSPRRDFWSNPPTRQASGYYAEANELLEAWARPARDMQALIMDTCQVHVADDGGPPPAGARQGCLQTVQRDLLGGEKPTSPPSATDDSIQIHVCHSATREVEVLHDRLLGLFDDHPDLQPADVMVLTPDIDTYAPIIKAVFSAMGRIRFHVGRERFREGAAVTAFLDLLDLPGSRYTANAVVAPLRAESVRACFGIDEGDLEGIRDWLQRAGIRWGLNAEHRTPLGVPPSPNHTWHHGLRRLLLGYAIDRADVLHDDITPCALDRWGDTGANAYELLGRFHRYCELAFALNDWDTDERTPAEWAEQLRTRVLAPFFTAEQRFDPEVGREVGAVARLIDAFASECEQARASAPLSFTVLRDVLAEHAATSIRGVPRLADGVTVAGLATGQVLPAKVVCVVGMNDGAFPRRPPPTPFEFVQDLFGSAHAVGDRDVRDDDRFAFLAAVLAARRCLILTYTGRDLQEDKPIPASVVVSELTAYLERRFPDIAGWETRHPLQPFSPRYFRNDEPDLFSYAKPMADAASALGARDAPPRRFAGELAPRAAKSTSAEVDIEELVRFSASPTTHFLRHVLRINLGVRDDEIDDDEPFQLDALQAWQLKSDLAGLGNAADERTNRLATASGLLPPGNLARIQHRESSDEIADLVDALAPFIDHTASADVDIDVNGTRVVGRVEGLHGDKTELVWHRIGRVRTKDEIAVWLRLLVLICAKGQPFAACLFGSKTASSPVVLSGPSPTIAREFLSDWVAAWHDGQCKALPFFPDTSWAAAEGNGLATPWSGMPWSEGNTDYHLLAYPDGPSADGFETLATKLLGPLQEARS